MRRHTQTLTRFTCMVAVVSSAAAAVAVPMAQAVVCGGVEYAHSVQHEKGSYPGLSQLRILHDGGDRDSVLDDTYARASGRNDVFSSAFAVPDGRQFRPVAQQLALYCDEDQPMLLARLLEWGDSEAGTKRSDYLFADYAADDQVDADTHYSAATGDGEWLAGGTFATLSRMPDRKRPKKTILGVAEVFSFEVIVDPALDIRLPVVAGFNDGDPERPTGRAQFGDSGTAEYVLDELQVMVPDDATLNGILTRWNALLVDRSPLDRDGVSTALVRFDPAVLATVDTSMLAEDLLAIEPDHRGVLALSSPRLAQLFALAAQEINEQGMVVAPNGLLQSDSITTGSTTEWADLSQGPDAFKWNFMSDQPGTMQTGVGRAWQVMDATVGFSEKVTVMIVDGGFIHNDDNPDSTILRQTEWGTESPLPNSSGGESPWHGSDSALSAAARVDNGYYTAGPAGPIAKLVLVGLFKDSYKTLRRARDMVDEYRPAVVNMSFSNYNYAFRKATEAIMNVYYKEMFDYGALLFASAGNKGRNVDDQISGDETPTILPCESEYVVCVGGLTGSGGHHSGSNYGTQKGSRSVELYGPHCTYGKVDHADSFNYAMAAVCGTSESSPFVAGVAALVKSANPNLSPTELRDLLYATAHTGAPFAAPLAGGWDRRIDAFAAVVAALGIDLDPPTVAIVAPSPGTEIGKFSSLDVKANASDTFDRPLKIDWSSNKDGALLTTSSGVFAPVYLTPGLHQIKARATDFRGVFTDKSVSVMVGAPSQVNILSPQVGAKLYEGQKMTFIATTYDPDTYGPVNDSDVIWNVRKNGADIWAGIGHIVSAPANTFGPGTYQVYIDADDGDGIATDSSSFTILAVPPGQHPPKATILLPDANKVLPSEYGAPLPISMLGSASDPEDGIISGTRFRWTALSDKGTKIVLCEGHQVPQDGNGGIVLPKNCASFVAHLGADNGAVSTTWAITLEAFDSTALVGIAQRSVTIYETVP